MDRNPDFSLGSVGEDGLESSLCSHFVQRFVSLVGLRLPGEDPRDVLNYMHATIFILFTIERVKEMPEGPTRNIWPTLTMSSGSSGYKVTAPEPFRSKLLFIRRILLCRLTNDLLLNLK